MKQQQCLCVFVLILLSTLILECNSRSLSKKSHQIDSKARVILPKSSDSSNFGLRTKSSPTHKKHTDKKKLSSISFAEKSSRYQNPYRKLQTEQVFNDNSYEGWLTVQADSLNDGKKYPTIPGILDPAGKIPLDSEFKVINKSWSKDNKDIPTKYHLWARLRGRYVYFSNDNKALNILFYIHFDKITGVEGLKSDEEYCTNVYEGENKWSFCAVSEPQIEKWTCYFTATLNNTDLKAECDNPKATPVQTKIIERKIEQPFIVIPIPQEFCNSKWDYEENGNNWQCLCKEGTEQSPIDLPPPKKAIDSSAKPIFDYLVVGPLHSDSGLDGKVKAGTPIRIEHDHGSLKIFHSNLGKIVTLDGTVYIAEEIVFHTPSEHTINGEKFPMEMQVVHRAKTRGDYGKQLILSFLFKAKAGVYNKFIDSLDFFMIPNTNEKSKRLFEKIYVPNVLLNNEDADTTMLQSFSFYTYQGSITTPPCAEKVIHMVASKPIHLSTTAIEMFKEALREPDFQDAAGNIILAKPQSLSNARATQPLNGRSVFHYDHVNYGLPTLTKKDLEEQPKGHYEKQANESVEYFFVEGNNPSGVPGAIVVSDNEANSNK